MRKLATIATIDQILPHPNANSLELAKVRGWQVVVKKGEFKEGDFCVYCEIDSVFPECPEFEFMRERKFRVRTIKLRCELSQGICFPVSILEGHAQIKLDDDGDVTEALGIKLYQPPMPACLGGDVVGSFPSFIPKTDCERIQNHSWILSDLFRVEWVATEKLDGSSCTIYWKDGSLHVCSRNWELREDDRNAFWQAVKSAGLIDKLQDCPIALQGELLGPKIQGNRYGLKQPTLCFFDAYDMNEGRYLNPMHFWTLCEQLDVLYAPIVCSGAKLGLHTVDKLLHEAEGKSCLNTNTEREGLVWKPRVEMTDDRIGRVAFKTISNKFLLKQKD